MNTLAQWARRLWYLLNRAKLQRELEAEMEEHRRQIGNPRQFGNTLRLREEAGDIWGWSWLDDIAHDIRYGLRILRKSPGFAATTILILTLGFGLNLAFFQLINVSLLRPLPIRDPHTLVRLRRHSKHMSSSGVPYAATQFVRRHNTVLSAVITQTGRFELAWGDNAADRIRGNFVSPNLFEELGYDAAIGRVLHESVDEKADSPPVVVLSHEFWLSRFGRDPNIVGRIIRLNNRPVAVVGVASAGFPGLRYDDSQLWTPIQQIDYFNPGTDFKENSRAYSCEMYGRLLPRVSPGAAMDGLRASMRELGRERPNDYESEEWLETLLGTEHFRTGQERYEQFSVYLLVWALTLLVLLVACSNLTNLVLSRMTHRLREFSVRTALGAGRWRLMRMQLIEIGILSLAGLSAGVLLGNGAATRMAGTISLPSYVDIRPDWQTALASLVLLILTMGLCGLIPALRGSAQNLTAAMKDGSHQAAGNFRRSRLQQVLLTGQIAGSCVLLIFAAFMVRSLDRLLHADAGFEFDKVAVLDAALYRYGLAADSARSYWKQVKAEVERNPEVERVALVSYAPLGDSLSQTEYNDAPGLYVVENSVDNGFFEVMNVPIIAGRAFLPGDNPKDVVVVSRRLAEALYGTFDVVGNGFPKTKPTARIVGVAANAKMIRLRATDTAERYAPLQPDRYAGVKLLAKARTSPARLLEPMRTAARSADDRILAEARLMKSDFEKKLQGPRTGSLVSSLIGFLALALASLGIFGLISYSLSLRIKEIGIRIALGAQGSSIIRLLVRRVAWPLGAGVPIGAAIGLSLGYILRKEPFYFQLDDPLAPAAALLILAIVAGIAALLPARRALRIDPLRALRHD